MFGNDITKCEGIKCPMKEQCYRYTVKADRIQSYSEFWGLVKNDRCEYFWDNEVRNECNQA